VCRHNLETYYEALDSGMPGGFISSRLCGIPSRQAALISDACYARGNQSGRFPATAVLSQFLTFQRWRDTPGVA